MSDSAPIHLDHNASTALLPEVVEAMLPYLREHFGNPSSGHVFGTRARKAVGRARGQVAALLGCDDEMVFTSGGTEANNLAIRGVAEARDDRRHLVTTALAPFVGATLAVPLLGERPSAVAYPAAALMAVGLWLHLSERHHHAHEHDAHHQHPHAGGVEARDGHAHRHRHALLRHRHAHFPDTHHRHPHG
ncbi:MAG: aminotransferase class V-fold PLP-dependent enzyme [Myxococcaceae bacterium]|nr:MAG: aminotransferase class V-fold PLP-dependent enzyme [Myxococcaceae bacterium]